MSKKKWAVTTSLVVLFLAFVLLVPIRQESYVAYEQYPITTYVDMQEPYSVTEYYMVQEPYTVIEDVWVQRPSTKSVPITYTVVEASSDWYAFVAGFHAWVNIQNTDTVGGSFSVDFDLNLFGGGWAKESAVVYVPAGGRGKAEITYKGQYLGSFTYHVTAPSKTATVYTSVQEKQEVVKYRDVQHSRQVTKYRTVSEEGTEWATHQVIRYRQVSIIGIVW